MCVCCIVFFELLFFHLITRMLSPFGVSSPFRVDVNVPCRSTAAATLRLGSGRRKKASGNRVFAFFTVLAWFISAHLFKKHTEKRHGGEGEWKVCVYV